MMIPIRILLIEDSEDDAFLIIRELRRGDYVPTWKRVDTAETLLAALASSQWDVITCDWVMPAFSAPHALQLLGDQHVDVPIIIVSGEVGEEFAVAAMKGGAHDFISKERLARLCPAVERELHEADERRARKRAEADLREQKLLLDTAQRLAHVGSWQWEIATDVMRWSDELCRIFGQQPAEFDGTFAAYLQCVHSDDRDMARRAIETYVRRAQPFAFEQRIRRPDGEVRIIQTTGEVISDDSGKPVRMYGATQDITERKRAQDIMRQQTAELENLYNNASCGYHSLDRNGVFVRINDTELRWLGYSREELLGRDATLVIAAGDNDRFAKTFAGFAERGYIKDLEVRMLRKDGSSFPVLLNSVAVKNAAGEFVMSNTTIVDLSERKRVASS